jgi:transcription elongation factor GreA
VLGILENAEIAEPTASDEVGILSIVTILFEGDSEDDAEQYLIGHVEEKRTDGVAVEVMSPVSPIGGALLGKKAQERVEITLENGAKVAVIVLKVEN